MRAAGRLDRPIFLLGSHKSGTSLLRSLLDGVPGLAVLPKESHAFQFTGHWVDYPLRRALPHPEDGAGRLERLLGRLREMNEARNRFSDLQTFHGFDLDVVRLRLQPHIEAPPAVLVNAYLLALYEAWAGRPLGAGERLVEKSVEHTEFAWILERFFPDACFVHIVRDPHGTLVALRRAKSGAGYPRMRPLAGSLYNSYVHLFRNRTALRSYVVLRYEDLVSEPESTMRALAGQLGLDWTDALMRPTAEGRPWGGNSTTGRSFTGISTAPLEAWKTEITPYEEAVVRRIATPVLDAFEYPPRPVRRRRTTWRPNPGERPATWLRNRVYLSELEVGR